MKTKLATFTLVGTSPLLFSKPVFDEKGDDETHEMCEERTWIQRAHVDSDGDVCLPATQVHNSLVWAGGWLGMKIPGKGQSTYTKRFRSGVMMLDVSFKVANGNGEIVQPDKCQKLSLFVPLDGKRGGQRRGWRHFPVVSPWSIEARAQIIDEAISDRVFAKHLETAGVYDGLGSMRVGTGGPNGRFGVENLKFEEQNLG